jgi:2-hydroxy fatty acid dioxygenase
VQCTNSPTLIPLPDWLASPNFPLNLAALVAFVYSGFYILLEPVVGIILLPIIFGWTVYANHLTATYKYEANVAGVAVEIVSWIAQFIGHGVFEHRAPAVLDNLLQSLVLAPFFVFMELLFKFGYRPELHKRVETAVTKEIKKFKDQKPSKVAVNKKAN